MNSTLMIHDLPMDNTLDRKAMAAVCGGNNNVPPQPSDRGYLIGWVINSSDQPIKFDGLIGDAILREANGAVSAYNAIPIQSAGNFSRSTYYSQ